MSDAGLAPLRRALISVSDKTGIVEFAKALAAGGVEILSTGGTCRLLRDEELTVVEVSDHTGFPEIMDGRVKTLHPKIHCGILGRRGVDDPVMNAHGIPAIDLIDFKYPNPYSNFWHTMDDVPENCSAESLGQVGRLMVDYIYYRENQNW